MVRVLRPERGTETNRERQLNNPLQIHSSEWIYYIPAIQAALLCLPYPALAGELY